MFNSPFNDRDRVWVLWQMALVLKAKFILVQAGGQLLCGTEGSPFGQTGAALEIQLTTACCLLLAAYLLPTAYCLLPTAHCALLTARRDAGDRTYCVLPTAHCSLLGATLEIQLTACCLLRTAHC